MASNCEDVSAQMMELLYGELPADARATVDAHVAGCARCRAELDGFEKTRALARRGLDEAPPARVHAAIIQAAAAHLAAQPQAQAQPAAAARRPAAPEKASFWDRLRTRWAFPTLATVGAVAVFMVANRVFLNPERTLERPTTQAPVPESPPLERAPAPIGEPAAAPEEKAQEPREADDGERQERRRGPAVASAHSGKWDEGGDVRGAGKKMKKAEEAGRRFADAPLAKAGGRADDKQAPADKFAPPPPPRDGLPAARVAKETKQAPMREQAEAPKMDLPRSSAPSRKPSPAIVAAPAPAQGLDELLPSGSLGPGGGGSLSGKGALGGVAPSRNKSDRYGAGAGAAQPAPAAPRPSANEATRAPVTASAESAPAAAPAPPPPPPAALAKSRAKSPAAMGGAADEDYEAAAAKDEKKTASKVSANDALMQRADRLFAEGRWAEAAALYRELLKREPRGDDAERWRRRLAAAENAEVAERRANVAAKRAAPPAEAESADRAAKPKAAKPAKSSAAAADTAQ